MINQRTHNFNEKKEEITGLSIFMLGSFLCELKVSRPWKIPLPFFTILSFALMRKEANFDVVFYFLFFQKFNYFEQYLSTFKNPHLLNEMNAFHLKYIIQIINMAGWEILFPEQRV